MTEITMPEPLEIDWPELHSEALGCGVEDRNIHDRYEAAEYGWQDAVDKCAERVPDEIFDAEQMKAYAAAKVREALEAVIQRLEAESAIAREHKAYAAVLALMSQAELIRVSIGKQ